MTARNRDYWQLLWKPYVLMVVFGAAWFLVAPAIGGYLLDYPAWTWVYALVFLSPIALFLLLGACVGWQTVKKFKGTLETAAIAGFLLAFVPLLALAAVVTLLEGVGRAQSMFAYGNNVFIIPVGCLLGVLSAWFGAVAAKRTK